MGGWYWVPYSEYHRRREMNKCYIEQVKNTLGLLPQIFAGVPVFNSPVGLFIHVLPASCKTALMWISKLKKAKPNVNFKNRTGFIFHRLLYSCVHKLCLGISGMLNYSSIHRAKIIYSPSVSYWMRLCCSRTNNRAQGDTFCSIGRGREGEITKLKCLEVY